MREKEQQDLMSDREQGWLVDWSYVPVFGSVHIDVPTRHSCGALRVPQEIGFGILGSWAACYIEYRCSRLAFLGAQGSVPSPYQTQSSKGHLQSRNRCLSAADISPLATLPQSKPKVCLPSNLV